MNGLELRMDTLLWAGYRVEKVTFEGHNGFCLFHNDVQQMPLCTMPKYAWDGAPKVERSVDAAHEHLVLPVDFNWELSSWTHGIYGRKWRVRIYAWDAGEHDDPIVETNDQTLAVAMCNAYRMFKEKALR